MPPSRNARAPPPCHASRGLKADRDTELALWPLWQAPSKSAGLSLDARLPGREVEQNEIDDGRNPLGTIDFAWQSVDVALRPRCACVDAEADRESALQSLSRASSAAAAYTASLARSAQQQQAEKASTDASESQGACRLASQPSPKMKGVAGSTRKVAPSPLSQGSSCRSKEPLFWSAR